MNIKRSNSSRGFTLVELIVVIAIIGILAAILVPAMIGYIVDAKLTSANASAKAVYTAINTYAEKCLIAGKPISAGGGDGKSSDYSYGIDTRTTGLSASASYVIGTASGDTDIPPVPDESFINPAGGPKIALVKEYVSEAVNMYMGDDAIGSLYAFRIGTNHFPTAVIWAKTAEDDYVGGYPNQADDKKWTLDKAAGED